ncbi:MAG TPA: polyribonucleotide nucleotidyltransferase [Acholeplasma sp.]|jgi:polyribonucleotide nucleotidyltransferase|nr:polyribonucleotide nucleotidyltransferase [Acholeplasma sp.]
MKKTFEFKQGSRTFVIETGEVAKQANGAVVTNFGDTTVLSVAVHNSDNFNAGFFPLTVVYQEKLYAAGKIPGGFLRREGRSSEIETLNARLIDRPIRPLFPEGFKDEVQIINMVLSSDPDNSPAMAAMLGSSLALMISDIPFNGPIAGVEVGLVDGKFIINPTEEEQANSELALSIAGTKHAINMVEASSKNISEDVMLEALLFGHEEIKRLVAFQEEIIKEVGKEKLEVYLDLISEDKVAKVEDYIGKDLRKAVSIVEKQERAAKIDELTKKTVEYFVALAPAEEAEEYERIAKEACENIVAGEVRRLITQEKIRPDGRKTDEIRPLSSRVHVVTRPHGSALFTRGQTQAFTTVTLGSLAESQIIDGLTSEESKRFMLQYNFPQFSVGETGRYGGPGRREIGHGALGEKALMNIIPDEDTFPYTIRVVSEILESNGSSSQASICAGTLALMDAGVPIKAPVAGIAMGLIMDGKDYTILTDIQGMEDHFGDMDFKVAGTKDGITALQMDIKISGVTAEILKEALAQAKKGRLEILNHMLGTISEPRKELSPYAPKVKMIRINPDKIKDVIGSGGKVINEIIEKTNNVKIDIEQDGRVFIMHQEYEWIDKAIEIIENIVREAEVGKIYEGTVIRIESYGAFLRLWEGCEGLLHISKIAHEKVAKVEDVLAIGDQIAVKVIGIDDKGRIDLSRKDTLENPNKGKEEDKPKRPRRKFPKKEQ